MITINEFKRMEIVIGEIKEVEDVQGADKLFKITVDIGDKTKQLVAGIKTSYKKEELKGKQIVVLNNLEPAKIRGIESQGMLLAATDNDKPILLTTDKRVKPGSKVS